MRRLLLPAVLLASMLAACGGGGGGGGSIPTVPTPSNKVSIGAGFSGSAGASFRHGRGAQSRFRSPLDVTLQALPAIAEFGVPDPYILPAGQGNGEVDAVAIAYLNTSDGTLNGIPNPLPSPIFSQSGVSLPTNPSHVLPTMPPTAPVEIGNAVYLPPATPGLTTINVSAPVNGQTLTAQIQAYSYPQLCLAAPNNNQPDGCATGLYWDALGTEHTTTDPAQADVYMEMNADGVTTSFVFPNGATELQPAQGEGGIDIGSVLTAPASIPTTQSVFPSLDGYNSGIMYVFRTTGGLDVKWSIGALASGNGPGGVNTGNIGTAFGLYLAADASGNFAY